MSSYTFTYVHTIKYERKVGGLPGVDMTTVHDIPADLMISSLSAKLEVDGIVNQPEWSTFVKTGIHREEDSSSRELVGYQKRSSAEESCYEGAHRCK